MTKKLDVDDKRWSSHIGVCVLCKKNTYLHRNLYCYDCKSIVPDYIPEPQREKYYHKKIRHT